MNPWSLSLRVQSSISGAKASNAQLTSICLSEEMHKPFTLSRVFLVIQRREKCPSREEKSAFP